jgi:hypothetical protein
MKQGRVIQPLDLSNVCTDCRRNQGKRLTQQGSRVRLTNQAYWEINPIEVHERQCVRCHVRKPWWDYVK